MSDSAEMRRLILHAADRLAAERPLPPLVDAIQRASYGDTPPLTRSAMSLVAAMALAEGTLRMVAACMATEEPEAPKPTTTVKLREIASTAARDENGRFVKAAES